MNGSFICQAKPHALLENLENSLHRLANHQRYCLMV